MLGVLPSLGGAVFRQEVRPFGWGLVDEDHWMNDTVSAANAWVPSDVRLNFMGVAETVVSPDWSSAHIAGAAHSSDASSTLIVNFVTLSPDSYGWTAATNTDPAPAIMDQMPASISGFSAGIPDAAAPVVVGALNST
jgi:hypothetical protein